MDLRADDGAVVTDSPKMTRTLTNYYVSVNRTDEGKDHASLQEPSTIMNVPRFTTAVVHKELSTLDTAKGPDDLHPFMLQILADLYNKSIHSGEFPLYWRKAIICPIF